MEQVDVENSWTMLYYAVLWLIVTRGKPLGFAKKRPWVFVEGLWLATRIRIPWPMTQWTWFPTVKPIAYISHLKNTQGISLQETKSFTPGNQWFLERWSISFFGPNGLFSGANSALLVSGSVIQQGAGTPPGCEKKNRGSQPCLILPLPF